jgi:hypothetical protein
MHRNPESGRFMAEQPETQAAPEQLAQVTLTRREVICWPRHDSKTKGDGAIPSGVIQTWPVHDIIRVYGL